MKLKTYKTLYGYYNGPGENNINLTENMKLVYNDEDVGNGLTFGHNHYIGFIKSSGNVFFVLNAIKYLSSSNSFIIS